MYQRDLSEIDWASVSVVKPMDPSLRRDMSIGFSNIRACHSKVSMKGYCNLNGKGSGLAGKGSGLAGMIRRNRPSQFCRQPTIVGYFDIERARPGRSKRAALPTAVTGYHEWADLRREKGPSGARNRTLRPSRSHILASDKNAYRGRGDMRRTGQVLD